MNDPLICDRCGGEIIGEFSGIGGPNGMYISHFGIGSCATKEED